MANEKKRILNLLIENQEEEFSIRQIAKKRKINYKSAYSNIQKLEKEGVILLKKQGNISLCSFNKKFNSSVYQVEYSRREELFKNKNFKVIYNRLEKVNQQFILLLFGSYSKKTQTKHSDIDFLLITENSLQIQREIELIPLNIHLTSITYNDFLTMLKSKELTVVSEALKHNIILFGIEDYYRLVNNVG